MTFDITTVPFSRYGSYMALSRWGASADHPAGIVLRTVRGDADKRVVFTIELFQDGKTLATTEQAEPAALRLECKQGWARLCFADANCIRFQARNVGVRVTLRHGSGLAFAMPADDGRWQVNSFVHRSSYALTAIRGQLTVDAPWEKGRSTQVVAEFTPGPRGGVTIEGAIEEIGSVLPQRDMRTSFEDCVRGVQADFDKWLKNSPSAPESLRAAGELAAYVNWSACVAPEGHFRRPAMLMSKNWMLHVWSWDHAFNAMALSHSNPELAWDQLMIPFDQQDENGALPDAYNDRSVVRSFVKPPIHGWALRYMMNAGDAVTTRRLREFYGPLCKWTDWWMQHRDSDKDGIPHYQHGNDSGWDNSTAFDVGVPLEGPDLSAFLIVQMDVLADIAKRIGKKRDAHRWTKRADQLLERLLAHSWNGSEFIAPRSADHKLAEGGDSLVLFMPLLLGNRLPAEIRQKLVAGVSEEGRFLTKHGLATENVKSGKYDPDGYWRGPIWAPSTMLIVDGLLVCGQKALAVEIAKRFCQTVAGSGMAENFDALTGKRLRDPAYTWTSSVFQILAHDLLRGRRG